MKKKKSAQFEKKTFDGKTKQTNKQITINKTGPVFPMGREGNECSKFVSL